MALSDLKEHVKYSYEELVEAYKRWALGPIPTYETDPRTRIREWDIYCDVRDSLPKGTHAERRLKRDLHPDVRDYL